MGLKLEFSNLGGCACAIARGKCKYDGLTPPTGNSPGERKGRKHSGVHEYGLHGGHHYSAPRFCQDGISRRATMPIESSKLALEIPSENRRCAARKPRQAAPDRQKREIFVLFTPSKHPFFFNKKCANLLFLNNNFFRFDFGTGQKTYCNKIQKTF